MPKSFAFEKYIVFGKKALNKIDYLGNATRYCLDNCNNAGLVQLLVNYQTKKMLDLADSSTTNF